LKCRKTEECQVVTKGRPGVEKRGERWRNQENVEGFEVNVVISDKEKERKRGWGGREWGREGYYEKSGSKNGIERCQTSENEGKNVT